MSEGLKKYKALLDIRDVKDIVSASGIATMPSIQLSLLGKAGYARLQVTSSAS